MPILGPQAKTQAETPIPAGAGDQVVENAVAGVGHRIDGGGSAVRGRKVGRDLGVLDVDADRLVTLGIEVRADGGANARSGASDGGRGHGSRSLRMQQDAEERSRT
jgi:hypothetical protein